MRVGKFWGLVYHVLAMHLHSNTHTHSSTQKRETGREGGNSDRVDMRHCQWTQLKQQLWQQMLTLSTENKGESHCDYRIVQSMPPLTSRQTHLLLQWFNEGHVPNWIVTKRPSTQVKRTQHEKTHTFHNPCIAVLALPKIEFQQRQSKCMMLKPRGLQLQIFVDDGLWG